MNLFATRTALALAVAAAAPALAASGKLLLTGGVSSIDGAAGASAFVTGASTRHFDLAAGGVALVHDVRIELSLARQQLNVHGLLAPLDIPSLKLKQDIAGIKLRVAGDAVLDSDSWLPQVAIGVLHKRSDSGAFEPTLTGALGAKKRHRVLCQRDQTAAGARRSAVRRSSCARLRRARLRATARWR